MRRVIEPTDVGHLTEADRAYPVIVEYTERHVVWVDANTQDDAVAGIEDAPHEVTSSDTCIDGYSEVFAPTRYNEWEDVDRKHDAHVEAHRRHLAGIERAHVEAIVEDETRDGIADADRRTCAVCKRWREDGHDENALHLAEVAWAQREAERAGGETR